MRRMPRSLWLFALLLVLGVLAGCDSGSTKVTIFPTATTGDVRLTTDRASYASHEPIGVTVANKGKANLWAVDGRSACTYLQLELYNAKTKAWTAVVGCASVNPPVARLLPPAASLPYTLAPGDAPNDPNAWTPGTYRVAIQYGTQQDGGGTLQVAYSQVFTIVS